MNSSDSYKVSQTFAAIVVGEPKTGHTSLAMAFPKPWFLDLDLNLSAAVRRAPGKKFYFDQVVQVKPMDRYELAEKQIVEAIKSPDVETIVIDSITGVDTIVKEMILGKLKAQNVKLRTDTVDDQLRVADYATYQTFFLRLVALTRASGKYVIWTAHQRVEKDELTGILRYHLNMAGALKESLGAYFTDVWATTSEPMPGGKTKFAIRTKPTGRHISLGASFPIDAEVDVTDKSPDQIWALLQPKIIPVSQPITKV